VQFVAFCRSIILVFPCKNAAIMLNYICRMAAVFSAAADGDHQSVHAAGHFPVPLQGD
jgi:hypothetical protein